MVRTTSWLLILALVGCARSDAARNAGARLGQPAPALTLPALDGTPHALVTEGRITVLEWFNPGCPFVKHAHGEGPLRDQAARTTSQGITWLAINSGAEGKQGHGVEVNRAAKAEWSMEHPVLLDPDGAAGRAYGASTTPQMYVIDADGTLVYRGALDNKPLGRGEGVLKNFVELALADLAAGRPVGTADTKPYGCSVKY